jgi:hypothetical protein
MLFVGAISGFKNAGAREDRVSRTTISARNAIAPTVIE